MEGLVQMMAGLGLVLLVLVIVMVIACMRVFSKAGKPGWHAIIPFVNMYQLAVIGGKPGWWGIVACLVAIIPIVGAIASLVMLVMIYHGISQGFGKGAGFTVGLILLNPIFLLILAFGSAQYVGQGGGGEALATEPMPEPEQSHPPSQV